MPELVATIHIGLDAILTFEGPQARLFKELAQEGRTYSFKTGKKYGVSVVCTTSKCIIIE